ADGWTPQPIAEAVEDATLIALLIPDLSQPNLFEEQILSHLKPGSMLLFAHGFNIHYGLIKPPNHIDVGLVAPKGPGNLVRDQYTLGRGVPCLAAIHQNMSDHAWPRALDYARGLGGGRAAILQTTFAEETETDLFGEQAIICGGAAELVLAGWETLVEAGYSPEIAYFECLHELKLIVDLLQEGGLTGMHRFISDTASFGALTRGPRVIDEHARGRMKAILSEILSGAFAEEWARAWIEEQGGAGRYGALKDSHEAHPIEATGRALRARMAWLSNSGEDA
ncbi:MAG: ketol-acid reductoisomerase, partial [Myxococcota bacterium]